MARHHPADAKPACQPVGDERRGRRFGKTFVEVEDDGRVDAERLQQRKPLVHVRQLERRTGGVEILGGMWVERADQGRYALSAGQLQRAPHNGLMALMESVELAERKPHAASSERRTVGKKGEGPDYLGCRRSMK